MLNPDGTLRAMAIDGIRELRHAGTVREYGPPSASFKYRDVVGIDERVWQHLLDCADRVRRIEESAP